MHIMCNPELGLRVIMRQPVNRDRQIELATGFEDRVQKHVEKLLRVPVIRENISRPHPKQGERKTFVVRSVRAVRCA